MPRVVEYLGLPGVGKTWELGHQGFCGRAGASPHFVPEGRDRAKAANTVRGLIGNIGLFVLLLRVVMRSQQGRMSRAAIRPVLVVFERLGRLGSLRRQAGDATVHIDEGALQFIWRCFCEADLNHANHQILQRCVLLLGRQRSDVAYIACPKIRHTQQVHARGKAQAFDTSLVEGDLDYYRKGRDWMALLIRELRHYGRNVIYVQASPSVGLK